MNKKIIWLVMATLLSIGVSAVSVDEECKESGFGFGIVKVECESQIFEKGSAYDNYNVTVDWNNCESAVWNSNLTGVGVISKEGTATYIHYTSPITKTGQNDISHLTFCGKRVVEIPEMTTIGAVLALMGAGVFIYKKKGVRIGIESENG